MSPEDSVPLPRLLSGALWAAPAVSAGEIFACVFFLIVFTALLAFLTAAESAVPSVSESKLKKLIEDGSRSAKLLLHWQQEPERFVRRMRAGELLLLCVAAVLAVRTFAPMLASLLSALSLGENVSLALSAVVILLLAALLLLIFGYLLPQKNGSQHAESFALKSAGAVWLLHGLLAPFYRLGEWIARPLLRLGGCDPDADAESVTEEEIRMMVDAGEENGSIEESTKDMISNIFDFDDRAVSELMTHRTEVTAIEDTATIANVVKLAQEEGYSRIPVYHEDIDDIKGILYVKDLLRYVGSGTESAALKDIVRPAYFVPSFKKCSELFRELTEKKMQMAIVCDEYGGTYGIITMEDLIEAIVGNIQDEYDDEEEEISRIDENRFTVDGGASISEISDLLGVELPEGDYDTIGGFVVDQLGRIPQTGEHPVVTFENVTFTVQVVEDRRISQLLAERTPTKEDESN